MDQADHARYSHTSTAHSVPNPHPHPNTSSLSLSLTRTLTLTLALTLTLTQTQGFLAGQLSWSAEQIGSWDMSRMTVRRTPPAASPHISPISPRYLPHISPTSPSYLPHIPPLSPPYLPHISPDQARIMATRLSDMRPVLLYSGAQPP